MRLIVLKIYNIQSYKVSVNNKYIYYIILYYIRFSNDNMFDTLFVLRIYFGIIVGYIKLIYTMH